MSGARVDVAEPERPAIRYAFLGARSCELHAMGILERVLLGGAHPDPGDGARIEGAFIIAVQCGQAGGTCFCVSMNTGPVAERGFDLALTEVIDDGRHRLPARLLVYAVEGDRFDTGADLSPEVQAAIPEFVQMVLAGATASAETRLS